MPPSDDQAAPIADGPSREIPPPRPKKKPSGPKSIAEQVRDVIEARGLTPTTLAESSGVHASQLSRFANRKRDLNLRTFGRLVEVLGLDLVATKNGIRSNPEPRAGRAKARG